MCFLLCLDDIEIFKSTLGNTILGLVSCFDEKTGANHGLKPGLDVLFIYSIK